MIPLWIKTVVFGLSLLFSVMFTSKVLTEMMNKKSLPDTNFWGYGSVILWTSFYILSNL